MNARCESTGLLAAECAHCIPVEAVPKKASKRVDDAGLLYDYAVDHPEGFNNWDVSDKFGWSRDYFFAVVQTVRSLLAGDEITLVCEPAGQGQPWKYQLVGTYDAARPWATNRIGDLERRLDTIHNVASTLTNATDGRTAEGKKSRLIERTVRHLIENLADFAESA